MTNPSELTFTYEENKQIQELSKTNKEFKKNLLKIITAWRMDCTPVFE